MDIRLSNSEQIAAFHDGWAVQTGRTPLGSAGINELLGCLASVLDAARNHGDNRVRESPIVAIVLDDQRRPLLAAPSFDVGNLDDYNVPALHW